MRTHREYHFLWTQGQSQLGGAAGSWWWRGGQSDQGWNISQRSSQQPPASHPRILGSGPDNLPVSRGHHHNIHRAGAGDVPLHDHSQTISALSLHASIASPLYLGWLAGGAGAGVYKQQHNESVVPVLGPGEM